MSRWPERLTALLRRLPRAWVAALARALAPQPRLGWSPGWRFAMAEYDPTAGVRLRKAAWDAGAGRSDGGGLVQVRLPWLEGLVVETPLGTDLSRCLFVSGSYEPNELTLLSRVLEPGMTFLDVGANEGLFSLLAARRVGVAGRVIALEPSPRELRRLEHNLALNRLGNVAVLPLAASDRAGKARLHVAEEAHPGQSTLGAFAYEIGEAGATVVELLPLDRVGERCPVERLDAVKIDVEGAEVAVLRGARRILAQHRPLLLVELLDAALAGQGASREQLFAELAALGYELWVFGERGEPEPVSSIDKDGINFVAAHPERRFGLGR